MSITEKPLFTAKEVAQIVILVISVAGSYLATTYNMNIRFNELVASTDKIYIYIDEIKKDNQATEIRLQAVELGLRKNELDIARYLRK